MSNSSFIDSRTFDGFRKIVSEEFNEIWIVDLKGNARTSDERRRQEGGNIFNDQIRVGVAVYFCVKKNGAHGCRIFYESVRDYAKADEKRHFLSATCLPERAFEDIRPDVKGNWINLANSDFESLIPVASKETKSSKKREWEKAVFRSYSFGVVTNRDEWTYAESALELERKVKFLVTAYNDDLIRLGARARDQNIAALLDTSIKWTRAVKHDLARGVRYTFERGRIVPAMYRPFVRRLLYFSPRLNEMPNLMPRYFGAGAKASNRAVVFTDPTSQKPFMVMSVDSCPDMHLVGAAAGSVVLPLLVDGGGGFADNITD